MAPSDVDKAVLGSAIALATSGVNLIIALISRTGARKHQEAAAEYSSAVMHSIDALKQAMSETQRNLGNLISRL